MYIRDLLKNFQKTIKRNDYSIPDWTFTVVLMALTKAPFEPLSEVDVKYLTMKTLFLTTWASAARCSEIQLIPSTDEPKCTFITKHDFPPVCHSPVLIFFCKMISSSSSWP